METVLVWPRVVQQYISQSRDISTACTYTDAGVHQDVYIMYKPTSILHAHIITAVYTNCKYKTEHTHNKTNKLAFNNFIVHSNQVRLSCTLAVKLHHQLLHDYTHRHNYHTMTIVPSHTSAYHTLSYTTDELQSQYSIVIESGQESMCVGSEALNWREEERSVLVVNGEVSDLDTPTRPGGG